MSSSLSYRVAHATIGYRELKLDWGVVSAFLEGWNQRSIRGKRYELTVMCLIAGKQTAVSCLEKKGRSFIMEVPPFDPDSPLFHYFALIEKNGMLQLVPKVLVMFCPRDSAPARRCETIRQ